MISCFVLPVPDDAKGGSTIHDVGGDAKNEHKHAPAARLKGHETCRVWTLMATSSGSCLREAVEKMVLGLWRIDVVPPQEGIMGKSVWRVAFEAGKTQCLSVSACQVLFRVRISCIIAAAKSGFSRIATTRLCGNGLVQTHAAHHKACRQTEPGQAKACKGGKSKRREMREAAPRQHTAKKQKRKR